MTTTNTLQVKWYCFRFEAKKRIAKFVIKSTSTTMIIGNVVMTYSKKDADKIRENILDTPYNNCHQFEITDKQFGYITLTNADYNSVRNIEEICNLKKCKVLPNLLVNNFGKIALIPVTNMQFMGTQSLQRKSIWI